VPVQRINEIVRGKRMAIFHNGPPADFASDLRKPSGDIAGC